MYFKNCNKLLVLEQHKSLELSKLSLDDVASSLREDHEIPYGVIDGCTQNSSYKSLLAVLGIIDKNNKQILQSWAELADVAFNGNSDSMSVCRSSYDLSASSLITNSTSFSKFTHSNQSWFKTLTWIFEINLGFFKLNRHYLFISKIQVKVLNQLWFEWVNLEKEVEFVIKELALRSYELLQTLILSLLPLNATSASSAQLWSICLLFLSIIPSTARRDL